MDPTALPIIVAHRGYPKNHPQNSIEAIQAAADAGAKWVEIDVQMRDGELVLAHDFKFSGSEPLLSDFNQWLADNPAVSALVELKKESLQHYGLEPIVSACMQTMRGNWHPISFDYEALLMARKLGSPRPGWVVCHFDSAVGRAAAKINARWLITNQCFLPKGMLPVGCWEWMVYEVASADQAKSLVDRGVTWLETMRFSEISEGLRSGN